MLAGVCAADRRNRTSGRDNQLIVDAIVVRYVRLA